MRVAIAQTNPTVGDLAGNRRLVEEAAAKAAEEGADLVVLPEMAITGYPPMDLLERDGFVADQLAELSVLETASRRVAIVLGVVTRCPGGRPKQLANSAVLLAGGRQVAVRPKSLLPTYDVFDEKRYFTPATSRECVDLQGTKIGLTVCEDTWVDHVPYDANPVADLAAGGATLVVNPSASPWHVGKARERRALIAGLASGCNVPIALVNQVGGNDELVFDGGSFICDARGRIQTVLPLFRPGFAVADLPFDEASAGLAPDGVDEPSDTEQLEAGLVLGIRDYFLKQDLPPGAVIGLSGGIDSAVTAHLAVQALGSDRVLGIAMPGPFSSDHSLDDAFELGRNLGIEVRHVDINPIYRAYRDVFAALFGERDDYGLTQQNIQSRIRGAILMATSNQENRLVLATGNKSELSVGYCTLYGDTVGGLAVLGDVYKHDVYALARHANRDREVIPSSSIDKPPSAELAADQLDSDDLPDYDVLDAVLAQAIEGGRSLATLEPPPGCNEETMRRIVGRLDRNEYKRRQTPLILRTSPKAFGSGRRFPIVHRYER